MPRRIVEGRVVSDKMDKTVTVLVERRVMHAKYKKYVRMSSKYAAHDEGNQFKTGDLVTIEECRPISKRKTWKVISGVAADGQSVEVPAFNPSERVSAGPAVTAKPAAKAAKPAEKKEAAPKAEKPAAKAEKKEAAPKAAKPKAEAKKK